MASLSQGRTAAAQCGLFTQKSVPVIFEPPCTWHMGRRWYTPNIDVVTTDIKASRLVSRCRINVTCVYAGGNGLLQVSVCCKLLARYFLGALKRCKSLGAMCGLQEWRSMNLPVTSHKFGSMGSSLIAQNDRTLAPTQTSCDEIIRRNLSNVPQ